MGLDKDSLEKQIKEKEMEGLEFCLVANLDFPIDELGRLENPKLPIKGEGVIVRPYKISTRYRTRLPPEIKENTYWNGLIADHYQRELYEISRHDILQNTRNRTKAIRAWKKWVNENTNRIVFAELLDRILAYLIPSYPAVIFIDYEDHAIHDLRVRNPSIFVGKAEEVEHFCDLYPIRKKCIDKYEFIIEKSTDPNYALVFRKEIEI